MNILSGIQVQCCLCFLASRIFGLFVLILTHSIRPKRFFPHLVCFTLLLRLWVNQYKMHHPETICCVFLSHSICVLSSSSIKLRNGFPVARLLPFAPLPLKIELLCLVHSFYLSLALSVSLCVYFSQYTVIMITCDNMKLISTVVYSA